MSPLTERLKAKLAFDQKGFECEVRRYSFSHGEETKDGEHLSHDQVTAALKHLVLFEHTRLKPLLDALVELASEVAPLIDAPDAQCFSEARVRTEQALQRLAEIVGE